MAREYAEGGLTGAHAAFLGIELETAAFALPFSLVRAYRCLAIRASARRAAKR
jgi:hypothetical protein